MLYHEATRRPVWDSHQHVENHRVGELSSARVRPITSHYAPTRPRLVLKGESPSVVHRVSCRCPLMGGA